jgi:hypothetical protein
MPRVTQPDLLFPKGENPLRLAGDCLVIGALFAAIAYFPLLMVALTTTVDLRGWIVGVLAAAGVAAAGYVFFRAWSPRYAASERLIAAPKPTPVSQAASARSSAKTPGSAPAPIEQSSRHQVAAQKARTARRATRNLVSEGSDSVTVCVIASDLNISNAELSPMRDP